ncbi:MAG: tetratricopeptide repeat protein [Desulfatiglandales bacterium]
MPKLKGRASRNDLKAPDEFLTFSQRVMAYVRSHKKQVYGAIIGILAIVSLYTAGWAYWVYMNKKALLLYGTAVSRFNSVAFDQERLKNEKDMISKPFQDVYERFPISKASKLINPFLAYISYNTGDLENAIKGYESFSGRFDKGSEFHKLSLLALSKCLEEKGELDKAVEVLNKVSLEESDPISAALIYQKIRLSYLRGESKAKEEAKALIGKLKETWPDYPLLPLLEAR